MPGPDRGFVSFFFKSRCLKPEPVHEMPDRRGQAYWNRLKRTAVAESWDPFLFFGMISHDMGNCHGMGLHGVSQTWPLNKIGFASRM